MLRAGLLVLQQKSGGVRFDNNLVLLAEDDSPLLSHLHGLLRILAL